MRRRLAIQHHGQLPGQVGHVAQAGVHALAEERRLQMGRIADEECTPFLESIGHARVVQVDAGALDGGQRDALLVVLAEQAHDVFVLQRLFLAILRQQHELEAPVAIGQIDHHVRTLGIAVDARERFVQRIVLHVDDQPLGGVRNAFQFNADQFAHRALAAISADDIIGLHCHGLAAGRLGRDFDAIGVLAQLLYLPAELHAHVRVAIQPLPQTHLGKRLHEHVAARPAERLLAGTHEGEAAAL